MEMDRDFNVGEAKGIEVGESMEETSEKRRWWIASRDRESESVGDGEKVLRNQG